MKTLFKTSLAIVAMVALILTGCKKSDSDSPASNPITLNTGDQHCHYLDSIQISATSSSTITYSTSSKYHAKVDQTGLVVANKVGTATITLSNGSDTKSLKIYVEPLCDYYTLPNFKFGVTTRDQVIAQYGTPDQQNSTMIGYYINDEPKLVMVAFQFENNKLKSMGYTHPKQAYYYHLAFLSERYELIDVSTNLLMFINALNINDATMVAGLKKGTDNYDLTVYISANSKDADMESTADEYVKAFGL